MTQPSGLGSKSRAQLGKVVKAARGIITAAQAAKTLNLSAAQTASLLSRWAASGWLSRVKRGVYIPVPLEAESSDIAIAEPWLLAHVLFAPCYIGGWSAAEHWDLTEQIFNSIVVLTTRQVHKRSAQLKGARFQIKTVTEKTFFGLNSVWLEGKKVSVSDPTRTILDVFNDPRLGGGIRFATEILANYMHSKHRNLPLLLEYGDKLGNSAVYKRLGFVMEREFPIEIPFIEKCRERIRAGYSQLDPRSPSNRLVSAWNLWVPDSLKGQNR